MAVVLCQVITMFIQSEFLELQERQMLWCLSRGNKCCFDEGERKMLEEETLIDPEYEAAEYGEEKEMVQQPPAPLLLPRKQCHSAPQSPACTPPKYDPQHPDQLVNRKYAKLKRQVSFPEDEFIVTGYLEPRLPWINCKFVNGRDYPCDYDCHYDYHYAIWFIIYAVGVDVAAFF